MNDLLLVSFFEIFNFENGIHQYEVWLPDTINTHSLSQSLSFFRQQCVDIWRTEKKCIFSSSILPLGLQRKQEDNEKNSTQFGYDNHIRDMYNSFTYETGI